MATEQIRITVTESGSREAAVSIRGVGDAATSSEKALSLLQDAMNLSQGAAAIRSQLALIDGAQQKQLGAVSSVAAGYANATSSQLTYANALKTVGAAYGPLTAGVQTYVGAVTGTGTAGLTAAQGVGAYAASARLGATATGSLVAQIREASSSVTQFRVPLRSANDEARNFVTFSTLLKTALSFTGIELGINAVRDAVRGYIELSNTYQQAYNRVRLVSASNQEAAATLRELTGVARESLTPLKDTVELYARLTLSSDRLNISYADRIKFTRAVSQSIILSGATDREATNGLIQFTQALSLGTLRGFELRAVLQELPYVAKVLGQQLGLTRDAMRLLGAQGKLTADDLVRAFLQGAPDINKAFKNIVPTISQSLTNLKTSITSAVGEFNASTGATVFLGNAIGVVAANIGELTRVLLIALGLFGLLRLEAYATAAGVTTLRDAWAALVVVFDTGLLSIGKLGAGLAALRSSLVLRIAVPTSFLALSSGSGQGRGDQFTVPEDVLARQIELMKLISGEAQKHAASTQQEKFARDQILLVGEEAAKLDLTTEAGLIRQRELLEDIKKLRSPGIVTVQPQEPQTPAADQLDVPFLERVFRTAQPGVSNLGFDDRLRSLLDVLKETQAAVGRLDPVKAVAFVEAVKKSLDDARSAGSAAANRAEVELNRILDLRARTAPTSRSPLDLRTNDQRSAADLIFTQTKEHVQQEEQLLRIREQSGAAAAEGEKAVIALRKELEQKTATVLPQQKAELENLVRSNGELKIESVLRQQIRDTFRDLTDQASVIGLGTVEREAELKILPVRNQMLKDAGFIDEEVLGVLRAQYIETIQLTKADELRRGLVTDTLQAQDDERSLLSVSLDKRAAEAEVLKVINAYRKAGIVAEQTLLDKIRERFTTTQKLKAVDELNRSNQDALTATQFEAHLTFLPPSEQEVEHALQPLRDAISKAGLTSDDVRLFFGTTLDSLFETFRRTIAGKQFQTQVQKPIDDAVTAAKDQQILLGFSTTQRDIEGQILQFKSQYHAFFGKDVDLDEAHLAALREQLETNAKLKETESVTNSILGDRAQILKDINEARRLRGASALSSRDLPGSDSPSDSQLQRKELQDRNTLLQNDPSVGAGIESGLNELQLKITDFASITKQTLVDAFSGAEDALVEFVKTGTVSFKGLVDSILADLTRLLARQALGLLLGSSGGGGAAASGLLGLLGTFGSSSESLPADAVGPPQEGSPGTGLFGLLAGLVISGARADGGSVSAGMIYRVGERGEEYFRPSVAGTIIPNHEIFQPQQSGAAGGPGGGGPGGGNVSIVVVHDRDAIQAELADPRNDHLIVASLGRNREAAKQHLRIN